MFKYICTLLFIVLTSVAQAQFVRHLSPEVRSGQVELNGEWGAIPVMTLGSDDILSFSFDEMSHKYRRYTYRITHCNSDWMQSELLEIDYLEGFNGMAVEEWENSVNTTQLYTHYEFSLPNENVFLKASGNYIVDIIDEDSSDGTPSLQFLFSVVEPKVSVVATLSGDTDRSLNGGEQQLSFSVDFLRHAVSSPQNDIKPVIYQNGRFDNAVVGIRPAYMTGNGVEYVHNARLIFDAGNEYRRFELTDPDSPGMNVEEVVYDGEAYHAFLYMDSPRRSHSSYRDENGRYFVNTIEGAGSPIEADYVYVHFALDVPYRSGGSYYLLGDFCSSGFGSGNRLEYDSGNGYYHTTQFLKLGLYNYMYVWIPDGGSAVDVSSVEGNYFNTDNEYLIYIYHRAFGDRYDRLVGVHRASYVLEKN